LEEIVAVARKWGNSIGITLSKETVDKEKIRPKDTLVITIKKATPIRELSGTLKLEEPTQKIKDELRRGWD